MASDVTPGATGSDKPTVLVFRKRLLPWSETFIAAQGGALERYHPVFVGYQREARGGRYLDGRDVVVLEDHAMLPPLAKAAHKALGWITPRWGSALAAHRPTLVHAHFGVNARAATTFARAFDVPLIVTYHGMDITKKPSASDRRERLRVFRSADRVIAVSDYIAGRVREAGCPPELITVHHIGVDTEHFAPGTPADRVPGRVLFVGRLVAKKGLDHLLRAMVRVRGEVPGSELVIAGDGPLRERMEALAGELGVPARFLGLQTPAEVRELMRSASVFAAPSVVAADGNAEGLPMTIVEAQACGLPVVAFPSGGSADGIDDGRTGFVVTPRDEDGLAERIVALLGDDAKRAAFSAAARDWAVAHFDLKTQTGKLERIYDEVRGAR